MQSIGNGCLFATLLAVLICLAIKEPIPTSLKVQTVLATMFYLVALQFGEK